MAQVLLIPLLQLSSPSPFLNPEQASSLLSQHISPRHLSEIHAAVLRANIHQHTIVNFRLQKSYASLGKLEKALILFRRTRDPTVFFWTNVIHSHAYHGFHVTALSLFSQMLCYGSASPNSFTLSSTLKACPLYLGKVVHGYAIKQTLNTGPYVSTSLLNMYARGGDVDSARYLFDKMPDRNLVSKTAMITCYAKLGDLNSARYMFDEMPERDSACWNTMMDGYTQHGQPNEAIKLFHEMLNSNSKPNEITIVSVLSAVTQIGCLISGKWVHDFIKDKVNRIKLNAKVGNALIDMYCKCASLEDACLVFDEMSEGVLDSLLVSCRIQKKFLLAEKIENYLDNNSLVINNCKTRD